MSAYYCCEEREKRGKYSLGSNLYTTHLNLAVKGKLISENQNSLNKNSFWSDLYRLVKIFEFFVTYGTMLRTGQYVLSAEIVSKSGYVYNFGYNF